MDIYSTLFNFLQINMFYDVVSIRMSLLELILKFVLSSLEIIKPKEIIC